MVQGMDPFLLETAALLVVMVENKAKLLCVLVEKH